MNIRPPSAGERLTAYRTPSPEASPPSAGWPTSSTSQAARTAHTAPRWEPSSGDFAMTHASATRSTSTSDHRGSANAAEWRANDFLVRLARRACWPRSALPATIHSRIPAPASRGTAADATRPLTAGLLRRRSRASNCADHGQVRGCIPPGSTRPVTATLGPTTRTSALAAPRGPDNADSCAP